MKVIKKQIAKKQIEIKWLEWKDNPSLYRTQSQFATAMQKIFVDSNGNALIDHDTITKNWIPKFTKKNKK